MIIGLTGSYAAGKDTVADYLVRKGFVYHSLSDMLREEMNKQGMPLSRANMIAFGNNLRRRFGAGVLAQRVLALIKKKKEVRSLAVSIRNPEEVTVFRKHKSFQLWFVDAPAKTRYERAIRRKRLGDEVSFDQFLKNEALENSTDPHAQQLQTVAKMADVTIMNGSDLALLRKKIDKLLIKVKA